MEAERAVSDGAYNQEDPSQSVLEPGLKKRSFFDVMIGLGFTGFASGLLTLFHHTSKKVYVILAIAGVTWLAGMVYIMV